MAILFGEPDGSVYAESIDTATHTRMSAATVVEAYVVANAADAAPELEKFLQASGIQIEPFTTGQAEIASAAHRRYGRGSGHPARLNLGDMFAYALAVAFDEPLLFKGADFARTDVRPALRAVET